MAAALDTALLATELADYLVKQGVPFREAHGLVGQAVRLGPLESLSLEALQRLSPAFEADVSAVWNFKAAVARRSALGGTAPASVRAQIAQARARAGQ
jgi:argininosuccinate lyase